MENSSICFDEANLIIALALKDEEEEMFAEAFKLAGELVRKKLEE
ncbi:MAG: hypothetical protein ACRDA4_08210 [Filifactoraceae bacterium]